MGRISLLSGLLCICMTVCVSTFAQDSNSLIPRPEKFHSIIPSDAVPELVAGGSESDEGLSMTEGPSWLNGKLYF